MPLVTSGDLGALLEAGVRTDFQNAYRTAYDGSMAQTIASVIETTQPVQKYAWLGGVPRMREFRDERVLRLLKKYEYSISDKVYEATIAVDRKALEDEQYGLLRLRAQELGQAVGVYYEEAVVNALIAGNTTIGPDGQYFFDSDHGESGTPQSNLVSLPLNSANLAQAITQMMKFTDDTNRPLGINPTHLLVGPNLKFTAMEILNSTVVVSRVGEGTAGGGATSATPYTNVLQGLLTLLVSPHITDNRWYLLDLSRPIKPIILQLRSNVPVEFVVLSNPDQHSDVFMRDVIYFGARTRFGVGYSLWQLALASIV